jgi:hypothetical protein
MQRGQHLGEAHASEVHTFGGLHPAHGYHTKAPNRNHDPAPNSNLLCGSHLLLSPHLNGLSRAHSLEGEKKHKESVSSQVRDQ